jgi:hypothetical protein
MTPQDRIKRMAEASSDETLDLWMELTRHIHIFSDALEGEHGGRLRLALDTHYAAQGLAAWVYSQEGGNGPVPEDVPDEPDWWPAAYAAHEATHLEHLTGELLVTALMDALNAADDRPRALLDALREGDESDRLTHSRYAAFREHDEC